LRVTKEVEDVLKLGGVDSEAFKLSVDFLLGEVRVYDE
jgi:hypothetical protein